MTKAYVCGRVLDLDRRVQQVSCARVVEEQLRERRQTAIQTEGRVRGDRRARAVAGHGERVRLVAGLGSLLCLRRDRVCRGALLERQRELRKRLGLGVSGDIDCAAANDEPTQFVLRDVVLGLGDSLLQVCWRVVDAAGDGNVEAAREFERSRTLLQVAGLRPEGIGGDERSEEGREQDEPGLWKHDGHRVGGSVGDRFNLGWTGEAPVVDASAFLYFPRRPLPSKPCPAVCISSRTAC